MAKTTAKSTAKSTAKTKSPKQQPKQQPKQPEHQPQQRPAEISERLTALLECRPELTEVVGNLIETLARRPPVGERIPSFYDIETASHAAGKQLARDLSAADVAELTARHPPQATCPGCGRSCETQVSIKEIHTRDGTIKTVETAADCQKCRRSFFPSA